jgi:nucleotide-binding universal stress UspA family protein
MTRPPRAYSLALSVDADQDWRSGMKDMVLGFDGSEESLDAVALARRLGEKGDGELHVAVVFPWDPLPVTVEEYERSRDEHFAEVQAQLEPALEKGSFTLHQLCESSVAGAIGDLAEEVGAELIVVGSTHRGKAGRVYPGSMAERLTQGAPCAVAVAPRGYAAGERDGAGVIGVGYIGTAECKLALELAAKLAGELGLSLKLIAAVPEFLTPGRIGGTDVGYSRAVQEEVEGELADARSQLPEGIAVETVMERGDAAEILSGQTDGLELLVLGSRGYGPLRRVLLGGVSTALMRTASCPVVVTPRTSGGKS